MRRLLPTLLLVLALVLAGWAAAQEESGAVDLGQWESIADRAADALSDPAEDTAFYERLRAELADWRAQLLEAQNANAARIRTIRAQIDGLGPPPDTEAGESEPAEISARRAQLAAELADAQAPAVRATEAYNEADGLIAEIDTLIRDRQTELLLEAGPSPVNPANWPAAVGAARDLAGDIVAEVEAALAPEWRRETLLRGAPLTLTLLAISALLLVRGRVWMARLTRWVHARGRRRGLVALGFLVSLGQIVLPLVGIGVLVSAIASTALTGPKGNQLLAGIVYLVLASYGALWLVGRLFPVDADLPAVITVAPRDQARARRRGLLVGVMTGLAGVLRAFSDFDEIGPLEEAVLAFPIYVGLAIGYVALARTFRNAARAVPEGETPGYGLRLLGIAGRALVVVAVAGLAIAALGYHNLADAIMMPTALTLGLLGLGIALQAPIRDLYAWATRTRLDTAREALVPVLVNFLLVLAALPVLAIIWGMRPAELGEVYARFNEGVTLGETRVTPGDILAVVLVFGIGLALTRLLQGTLKNTVLPRTRMDPGARNAITSFAGYVGIAIALLFAINAGGIDLTALAVVFGALSVGIGFGLQNVVQNFVAGIILLIERPIGEGDWIEVGGNMGTVKSISVRSTTIETFDRQQVIVPNADFISGTVTNWTRGSKIGRAVVPVGVAYGTDTRRVSEILLEIARENPWVAHYPEPAVDFLGFGADSLDFRIRAILTDVNQLLGVKTEMNHRIAERFTEEGIEIPFAQRDIWLRNPETLRAVVPGATAGGGGASNTSGAAGQSGLEGAADTDNDGDAD